MKAKFDIQINLNGWVIPFHIERQGYGIFKVAYKNLALGHMLLTERAKWFYIKNITGESLLNLPTRIAISKAIINY